MKINYNVAALRANRSLAASNRAVEKSLGKLSSGYKINRAVDDSAGMAIARKMKTQIEGLDQAARNGGDGISVLQTAEGTVTEIASMLQRMRELAVQAASDTNTMEDRKNLNEEIEQLKKEVDQLAEQTEYNTKTLLDGSLERVSYTNAPNVEVLSVSDEVTAADYGFSISSYGEPARLSVSLPSDALTEGGKIEINGESISFNAGESAEDVYEKLRDLCECVNINLSEEGEMKTVEAGSDKRIVINCDSSIASVLGIETYTVSDPGKDAGVELSSGFPETASATVKGNTISITDYNGYEIRMELLSEMDDANDEPTLTVENAGPLGVQVGANQTQDMDFNIPRISIKTLGIEKINLRSADGANESITTIDKALNRVNAIRAKIGAYQNRMESAIASLEAASENVTQAMSRVEDVDMASEMTTYTSKTVLAQAGTSMLAQANSRPQSVLSMLQM